MSRTFTYIKIEKGGKRYFCLRQSLLVLAWILYFHGDVLSPIDRTVWKRHSLMLLINKLRKCVGQLKSHAKSIFIFALYKYEWRSVKHVVELPQYGQLCLPVHQGYKIFDLWNKVTIKVFDSDVPESVIGREIEILKRISHIDFAPALQRWSLSEKWYEEDFLHGSLDSSYEPLDSMRLLKKFHDEIGQCLNQLIFLQNPVTKNVLEYVNEIIQDSNVSRFSDIETTEWDFKTIKRFLDMITDKLVMEDKGSVNLVFTHGDFVPANMLNTRKEIKIIDWENASCRSMLFDFYSYFFYRPVSRRVPVQTVFLEINEALPLFLTSVAKNASDLSSHARRFEKTYRWIFYIEILCKLIEREMSDKNLDIISCILRYIHVFKEFERLAVQSCQRSSA